MNATHNIINVKNILDNVSKNEKVIEWLRIRPLLLETSLSIDQLINSDSLALDT